MKQLENIVVGVDLSAGDWLVNDELAPEMETAIERAIWVAKLSSAHLHFFFALDVCGKTQEAIEEEADTKSTVLGAAERELKKLVDQAKQQGVEASYCIKFGKSWLELVRQVIRTDADLVIVGGRQHSPLERLFIGTTGQNLLRNCPCPVWVTHEPQEGSHGAILVAHDLTPVGERALDLGATLAELYDAQLHVVHAVDPMVPMIADPMFQFQAVPVSSETRQAAIDQIAEQLKTHQLAKPAEIQVIEGSPDVVLPEQIEQHAIDLLVMGTIARTGVRGLLIGNTAERMLPKIPCSVLAIKPKDFHTPVTLED